MSTEKLRSARVWTIGIGGAAGDGVREAGFHFGQLFQKSGFSVFLTSYYPSLIRGGHNFSRMSYATDKVYSDHKMLDFLVAVNEESVVLHKDEIAPGGIVLVDEAYYEKTKDLAPVVLAIPMERVAKESKSPRAAAPSFAFGVFMFITGSTMEELLSVSNSVFSDIAGGIEVNTALAGAGYTFAKENNFPSKTEFLEGKKENNGGELLEGNKAVGKGFQAAGLEFYIAYPMTPATGILHYLAKESVSGKLRVVHPEDEIAVINMALGVSYAGKRVAIGTANGGFALMQETFSFAGISELPLAIAVSQRHGPATGVPTHTSQSDLRFIIHSGHGEFPRVVIAPGDSEECLMAGAHALNLAWKYQIPAIVLLDKHISESLSSSFVDSSKISVESGKIDSSPNESYARYKLTEDGISPMAFPGTPGVDVKATSYEHEESGASTDKDETVQLMQDKRFKKQDALREEFAVRDSIKVYGDKESDTAIIFWGSTKGAVLEAAKYLSRPVKLVQILWVEPFDTERVQAELAHCTKIIDVEGNHNAQLAGLVREKTGIVVNETILKYDSEAFDTMDLVEKLNKLIG